MDRYWYVLQSKPHKEMALSRHIWQQGVEVYYPYIKVKRPRRKQFNFKPYFPRYMFVRADLDKVGMSFFQWMPYAVGLVTFGSIPARVPNEIVSFIQDHVKQINSTGRSKLYNFQSGDQVTIKSGPFDGYQAIFDSHLSGQDRVRVLLQLLNRRHVPVELDAEQLTKNS